MFINGKYGLNSNITLGLSFILIIIITSCSSINKSNDPKDLGDTAPSFTLESVDGEQVSLDDYIGKVVLLFFFGDG